MACPYGVRLTKSGFFYPQISLRTQILKQLERVAPVFEKHGVNELYIYGIDEAKGVLLSSQRQLWKKLRSKGIKIFVAGYKKTFEVIGDQLDLLVFAGPTDTREAEKYHAVGHKIYR